MKIRITMKDSEALRYAFCGSRADEDEREIAARFFQYGDYITIEVDTDNNTARVVGGNR